LFLLINFLCYKRIKLQSKYVNENNHILINLYIDYFFKKKNKNLIAYFILIL